MVPVKAPDSLTRTCQTNRHRVPPLASTYKWTGAEHVDVHALSPADYSAKAS
jgi:hypothetical protein